MTSYVNQYGTEYAVRKQETGPALMCRQRDSSHWVLSVTLANLVGDAKTDKELQSVLDKAAADKGWDPVRGFPDWELPMVQEILTWPWMPKTAEEFTTKHFKELDEVRHHQGGSIATGLYDTGPQGIQFSKLLEDGHVDADHTWADFVRRCIAQGIAPVPNADPISAGPASSAAESAAGSDASPAAESAGLPATQESDEAGCPLLEPVTNSTKYTCKCSICGEKFPNREICNKTFESCGWYQDWIETENKKQHSDCQCRTCEKESCFAHGCDKECPENAESTCLTTNCPEYQGKKDGTPCTDCRCSECNDDACPQAQCDRSDKGLGCMAPDDDCPPQNPTAAAPASPAGAGAATQSLSAAGSASLAAEAAEPPAFDYSGLDVPTRDALHWAEKEIGEARRDYIARLAQAVAIAHDALCATVVQNLDNGKFTKSEESFQRWCESVGIKRSTAYNLLQVQALLSGSTPEEQATLEAASPSLLYAAAKPSAPAELVRAVKDGDITSHKQYQELLAKLKAEQAARKKAETDAAYYRTDSESARAAADDYHRKYEDANTRCNALLDQQTDYITAKQDAESRAAAAENRASGAQKLADQRGTENTELKARIRELENQPRDVAVIQPDEEQIEAWRKEGEDRAAAALQDRLRKADQAKADAQRHVNALQTELAAARPDADACQRTADTLYETAENLRILLRTQLKQAQLSPTDYGKVVAHVLQVARTLLDTVRVCAPDGYDIDSEEDDDFE